jgi:hypothetical protein
VADRHHYVAQFHLRQFLDAESIGSVDPWVWYGDCADGKVRRRAPKKFGWERGLYDVQGAFSEPDATLERHLADHVEGPAAAAIRLFSEKDAGDRGEIPPEVTRYLSWAAARTPAMRNLFQEWSDAALSHPTPTEEPPSWITTIANRERPQRMEHPNHGVRDDVAQGEVRALKSQGWRLVLTAVDFGELVHVQAHSLFQQHFPRLQWLVLDSPPQCHFILGDRPVVWGFHGDTTVTPAALRLPTVQLVAPLTSRIALFAQGAGGHPPTNINFAEINRAVACSASDWVIGPTREVVLDALRMRGEGFAPGDR